MEAQFTPKKGKKLKIREKTLFKAQIFFFVFLFLFFTNSKAQKPLLKLKVATEQANIRLKPDIGSIIIQQVPQGTILESSGKVGEWYRIKIKAEELEAAYGYVHESLVIVISPPIEKEKKGKRAKIEKKEQPQKPAVTKAPLFVPSTPLPPEYLFELSFFGGENFIIGGDLNRGAKGLADYYSDSLDIKGEGKVKPVRLSYIFGGELTFPLSPYFSFGVGADYFLGQKQSRVDFQNSSSTDAYITRPKIKAVPVKVFLSYRPLPYFYLKAGIEYYFAQCAYFYRFQRAESWEEWQGKAKARDIGFLGGIGLEWKLSSPLSFTLEATGRYAPIRGFKGKNIYKNSEGFISTEEGQLYFYQKIRIMGEKGYPHILIYEKKPSVYVSDTKEAMVDFSGFSLKVGIKIRF